MNRPIPEISVRFRFVLIMLPTHFAKKNPQYENKMYKMQKNARR